MVMLYVAGQKVEWADAEKLFTETNEIPRIELRNDAGKVLGVVVPKTTARPDDPDWVKAITPEEIARRMAGEFLTFDEFKQRMGWK